MVSKIRTTEGLGQPGTEWGSRAIVPPLLLAEVSAKPTVYHSDGRPNDLKCGVVAGLLAEREDSSGVLVVANGADKSLTGTFRDAVGNVLEFDLNDLTYTAVVALRSHPHINNVLIHICGSQLDTIHGNRRQWMYLDQDPGTCASGCSAAVTGQLNL